MQRQPLWQQILIVFVGVVCAVTLVVTAAYLSDIKVFKDNLLIKTVIEKFK